MICQHSHSRLPSLGQYFRPDMGQLPVEVSRRSAQGACSLLVAEVDSHSLDVFERQLELAEVQGTPRWESRVGPVVEDKMAALRMAHHLVQGWVRVLLPHTVVAHKLLARLLRDLQCISFDSRQS